MNKKNEQRKKKKNAKPILTLDGKLIYKAA